MKKFTSTIIALAAVIGSHASVVDFTYDRSGGPLYSYGYGKIENINVAIRINTPELVGARVKSMSVPVTNDFTVNTIGDCTAFLTKELKKEGKTNVADICTEPATITDGILTCTFSEPYTITDEGVYVGYTMPITSVSASVKCNPIGVGEGTDPNGLFIFASRSVLSWSAESEKIGAVSAMKVVVEGDFKANSAELTLSPKYSLESGKKNEIGVSITNYGSSQIKNIEYTYSFGGATETGTKELNPAIEPIFGYTVGTTVSVNAPETNGNHTMELTLTKVNGEDISAPKLTATILTAPFKPYNRPLVEEFTGLGCGWCPRGYAALETLKEEYPETFIALAYHSSMFGTDPMETTTSFPVSINGLPSACVNRASVIDPGDLYTTWPVAAEKATDSSVEVDLSWANEEKTIIRATVKLRFLEDQDGSKFRVGACLVADDLSDPSWGQVNYYSTRSPEGNKILDNLFVGKDNPVAGLIFNDVMLSFPHKTGVANKLPKEIKQYEEVTYVEEFDLNKIHNLETFFKNPIQNIEKLRVVGVLFDKNGRPLNCGTSAYSTAGGEIIQPSIANPVITAMKPATDGNPAEVTFTCPTTYGGEEGILKPNGTPIGNGTNVTSYFRVSLYVDGELYTFTKDDYSGLSKNETRIVYGGEFGNTSFNNNQMTIKVFADNISTIGVQSNYVYGTKVISSEIIPIDAKEEFSEIESIKSESAILTIQYFDLQGRKISAPRTGQIVICRKAMSDGSVVSSKMKF